MSISYFARAFCKCTVWHDLPLVFLSSCVDTHMILFGSNAFICHAASGGRRHTSVGGKYAWRYVFVTLVPNKCCWLGVSYHFQLLFYPSLPHPDLWPFLKWLFASVLPLTTDFPSPSPFYFTVNTPLDPIFPRGVSSFQGRVLSIDIT